MVFFKAVTSNIKDFITFFSSINSAIDDIFTLYVENDGLYLKCELDSSHACITNIKISKSLFTSYLFKENFNIAINMSSFLQVLRLGSDGIMELQYEKSSDKITIKFIKGNDSSKSFDLRLFDIESREILEIPETEYDVSMNMASSEFSSIIRESNSFCDTIKFNITKQKISILSNGEIGNYNFSFKPTTDMKITNNIDSIEFSNQYLIKFTKASAISSDVNIKISENYPIRILYTHEHGFIEFYLAPKITD